MHNLYRKIELLANVAIILVALLITGVLAKNYLLPASPEPIAGIPAGSKVQLPDVDWGRNGKTLLLVLKKGCHFCTESAPFYQRLVRETAGRGDLHLAAVLPDSVDEGRQYLGDLGIRLDDVRQSRPDTLGVGGTPTLILVDGSGKVAASWVGRLAPDKEAEVLSRLQANSAAGD
ncbi:MAG: hypothetical protein JOZ96_17015 [Acidobacteria bacterium]|nr:hypothetical protein [Acidobacteriota bacterium]